MADLWLGNVASDVSDEEIKDFLIKYGFPPCDSIEHFPGDGSRPAVQVAFNQLSREALRRLQPRIDDMFWRNRRLTVQVIAPHPD